MVTWILWVCSRVNFVIIFISYCNSSLRNIFISFAQNSQRKEVRRHIRNRKERVKRNRKWERIKRQEFMIRLESGLWIEIALGINGYKDLAHTFIRSLQKACIDTWDLYIPDFNRNKYSKIGLMRKLRLRHEPFVCSGLEAMYYWY
jgi:hypothetical protein